MRIIPKILKGSALMKRPTVYLSLLFILLLFSACNKPSTGNDAANNKAINAGADNSSENKVSKIYPDMPPVIMTSQMKSLDGKPFTLKDYEGKIVLLNLWAIYCGPCRVEMPELVKVQDEYKDKNVVVIGLDIQGMEDSPEAVKALTDRMGITYKIGYSNDDATNALIGITKMTGIPQSFLITPDGKLAGVFKGYNPQRTPADVRTKIDDLLSQQGD
jgi:thiol-disulfide isomerase/thioredoxin